jgi:RND family efflux transporter MFP subunit
VLVSALLIVLVLSAGGASSAYLAGLRQPPPVREPEPRRYNVEVFSVESADVQEIVSAFGTALANREVTVAAQVAGELVDVHPELKVGTLVHAPEVAVSGTGEATEQPGDELARIDPQTYDERVAQIRNRIAEARTELERLTQEEKNLDRILDRWTADYEDQLQEFAKAEELYRKKIYTDSDFRRAQLELRQYEKNLLTSRNEKDLFPVRRQLAQQRWDALQNDLRLAELDVQRTVVRPPFTGRLSRVFVERGQYVKPGDPLVTLTDAAIVEIPLPVTLRDYAKLLPAVRAGRFPAVELAENETVPGRWRCRLVRVAPKADEQSRTVTVYVRVENREQTTPLLPGTFVHARIDGPVLEDVLIVPREAVLSGRGFVLDDERARIRSVKVARTLQTLAVIESGFAAGDRVILTNLDVLYDGAPVAPQSTRTLRDELQQRSTRVARLVNDPPDSK